MPSPSEITVSQLSRLIGTPACPVIIDVRIDEDVAADPTLLPGAMQYPFKDVAKLAPALQGRAAVVYCQKGKKISQGAAATLRDAGIPAEILAGGHFAWRDAGGIEIPLDKIPPRNAEGKTVWVTRHRPKIDRLACPWLIRRFIDRMRGFCSSRRLKCLMSRKNSMRRRSTLKAYSGAIAATGAVSTQWSMSSGCKAMRWSAWRRLCVARIRTVMTSRRNRRACWPRRLGCRVCIGTTWNSWMRR
jgi:rhodanese-related sulfurtransferase